MSKQNFLDVELPKEYQEQKKLDRPSGGNLSWLYNPNAKPAKDLSEHDQRMIKLGWDAKKTFSEQKKLESPDREKITNIIAYWIANERHGFGDVEESDWNNLSLCEKQSIWQNAKDIVDQIMALFPDTEQIDAMLVEARRAAKKQGEKKALRRIFRESKYLSPYELIHSIKQELKEE